jgi:GNAT superfamily N-acetyltransferase
VSKIPLAIQKSEDIEISFVKDKTELKIWEDISFTGFKMPQKERKQYNKFVESFDLSESSPQKLFLAYWLGRPVATALLFLQSNTAGIYFVTTLAANRNKGIAGSLILTSIEYAKTSGYKYCVLQSSKEGLNVYLKAGFKEYCRADVYLLQD